MQITKSIEWDMGHRIPNHKSKCRNPHGHRYQLQVTVEGDLGNQSGTSDQGMVVDFSDLKTLIQTKIHDVCDHGFMFYQNDSQMCAFFDINSEFKAIRVDFIPTAECIAEWIFAVLEKEIQKIYKTRLTLTKVQLWETPSSSATISKK